MSTLLEMLNHLIGAALAERDTYGALQVHRAWLEPDGLRVRATVAHPSCRGEVVLHLVAEPPQGSRQALRVVVERWPETLPPALDSLRGVLEKARLHLELDFS